MSSKHEKLKEINYSLGEGFELNQEGVWHVTCIKIKCKEHLFALLTRPCICSQ